jgi:hypothetical protein
MKTYSQFLLVGIVILGINFISFGQNIKQQKSTSRTSLATKKMSVPEHKSIGIQNQSSNVNSKNEYFLDLASEIHAINSQLKFDQIPANLIPSTKTNLLEKQRFFCKEVESYGLENLPLEAQGTYLKCLKIIDPEKRKEF